MEKAADFGQHRSRGKEIDLNPEVISIVKGLDNTTHAARLGKVTQTLCQHDVTRRARIARE